MILKCKMCGGDLPLIDGRTTLECEYCGTRQTIPSADSEKKLTLFNRANRLRMGAEFDKAMGVYESIVTEYPQEAEAYWGLCLCAYGIEYVDDPRTGEKIPTCHRTRPESILDSTNFQMACEHADAVAKQLYRSEAETIDALQRDILTIVAKESPYDVFICYKETGEDGERTQDSVLAQEIYDALTGRGLKVFFARITLEDKLGKEYEPYIYAALHSAKVMLVVGTSFEHFDAVWVKNEWSRFLDMASKDKSKILIPCYKNIDVYDIPKNLRNLQAQNIGKIGYLQDILRGIEKILNRQQSENQKSTKIDNFIFIAQNALESGNYAEAENYANRIIEEDFEHSEAWKIKGLALANQYNRLREAVKPITNSYDFCTENKKEVAESLLSSFEHCITSKLTMNAKSINNQEFDRYFSTACTAIQELEAHMKVRSTYLQSIKMQRERYAKNQWNLQVAPLMRDHPDVEKFDKFLSLFSFPINALNTLVTLEKNDPESNIRRLNKMIKWAKMAQGAKSWHMETEDEALTRAGMYGDALVGINRMINLAFHKPQWVVDYVMDESSIKFWDNNIKKWESMREKEKVTLLKLEQDKRELEAKEKAERLERIEMYWQKHPDEKKALEEKLNGLTEQIAQNDEQIRDVNNEIDQFRKQPTPLQLREKSLRDQIRLLDERKSQLGIFHGKEKKSISAEICQLTSQIPSSEAIRREQDDVQNSQQMQKLQARLNLLTNKKKELQEIMHQIEEELHKNC